MLSGSSMLVLLTCEVLLLVPNPDAAAGLAALFALLLVVLLLIEQPQMAKGRVLWPVICCVELPFKRKCPIAGHKCAPFKDEALSCGVVGAAILDCCACRSRVRGTQRGRAE